MGHAPSTSFSFDMIIDFLGHNEEGKDDPNKGEISTS